MRRFLIKGALGLAAVALLVVVVFLASPWPSVWVIRAVFDRGAATASAALEKHLPPGIATQTLVYDPSDPDAVLDIYRPAQVRPEAPTIVWIHGGGFVSGRRGDLEHYLKILAGRGFVVVNVDYTIAPAARYPTPPRQLSKALAFLDRNAARLGVNRHSLVLAGDSAGAQIAAQTAALITSAHYAEQVGIAAPIAPAQLRGTLLYCGVYDITRIGTSAGLLGWFVHSVTWAYSGKRDWREAEGFERMSVREHVTAAFPPAFISAGNADPLGPQSVALADKLKALGVQVDTLFYPSQHRPPLAHEYQFDLDGRDGQQALERSVVWLNSLSPGPPSGTPLR